jgi:hypothetical protein
MSDKKLLALEFCEITGGSIEDANRILKVIFTFVGINFRNSNGNLQKLLSITFLKVQNLPQRLNPKYKVKILLMTGRNKCVPQCNSKVESFRKIQLGKLSCNQNAADLVPRHQNLSLKVFVISKMKQNFMKQQVPSQSINRL